MNGTILIIEDNDQNLYMMRYLLEAKGFRVVEARDGSTGLKLARTTSVDAIVLDIQLPVMNGYMVAEELRKFLKEIPIIVVTSYAMTGDREKALASGATGYIEKPINTETFVDQIRDQIALGGSGSAR